MKDISEDLIASWLKHAKGCVIVESNWKISPDWVVQQQKLQDACNVFGEAKKSLKNLKLFGKVEDLFQMLSQCECDVVGWRYGRDGNEIYVVDIAFHTDGLDYGGKVETARRVAYKLLRAAFAMTLYGNDTHCIIAFTAPYLKSSFSSEIQDACNAVAKFMSTHPFFHRCEIRTYFDDEFVRDIMEPLKELVPIIDDQAEEFVRAVQINDFASVKGERDVCLDTPNMRRCLLLLSLRFSQLCSDVRSAEKILSHIKKLDAAKGVLRKKANVIRSVFGLCKWIYKQRSSVPLTRKIVEDKIVAKNITLEEYFKSKVK